MARQLEGPLRARVRALAGHDAISGAPAAAPPVVPTLAILLVQPDAAARRHAQLKIDACRRVGMAFQLVVQDDPPLTSRVLAEIDRLNDDPAVHGIFLQYPLPPGADARRCSDRIAAAKDVDGGAAASLGRLATGGGGHGAATAVGILRLLEHHHITLAGRRAVLVVGRPAPAPAMPLALMLLAADATVTLCNAAAADLPSIVAGGDLVVGATGVARSIHGAWLRDGAVAIDLGFHRLPGDPRPAGDIDPAGLAGRALAYTPVPGGAGPMTVAMLLAATVQSAAAAAAILPAVRDLPA